MRSTRRQFLQASGLGVAGLGLPWQDPAPVSAENPSIMPVASPLRFGINGHPYNTSPYDADSTPGVTYETQVAMLTAMGMDIYRTDIQTDAAGRALNHTKLLTMQGLLGDAGIDCLPVMYDNYSPDLSAQENYDRGYTRAAGFATNYGQFFTHYNLGNEWELSRDLLLRPDGDESSDYDTAKAALAMQWIKGANAGLKSVQPTAKTSISVSGYFPIWWQGYVLDNVGLDFIDWHWYAEMQSVIGNLPGNITNIFDFLWSEYGLPIWAGETNSRHDDDRSDTDNERRQVNWYTTIHQLCLEHPHVEALILYELLDEPTKGGEWEPNYGLATFPNFDPANPDYTDWEYKKLGRKLTGADRLIGGFESTAEGWALGLGPEYPGATGSFTRDNAETMAGSFAGLLRGDFSGGGNYVLISRSVDLDVRELRFWVRASTVDWVGLRINDSTGQTHQQRLPISTSGEWQETVVADFDSGLNYTHFGGANDGVWHGPATRVALVLDKAGLASGRTDGAVRFDEVVATIQDVP